jgi:hypothetical protein
MIGDPGRPGARLYSERPLELQIYIYNVRTDGWKVNTRPAAAT